MQFSVLLDIEVVMYLDDDKINEYDSMSPDDRKDIPLEGILKLGSICRQVRVFPKFNIFKARQIINLLSVIVFSRTNKDTI